MADGFTHLGGRILHPKKLPLIAEIKGSVEGALVMIPLVVLFLGVLQISSFAFSHGISSNNIQGAITRESLLEDQINAPANLNKSKIDVERINLGDGDGILIKIFEKSPTLFSSIFSGLRSYKVVGISVDEN